MQLAEKMFGRSTAACSLQGDCKKESDRRFVGTLFEDDWEVFVIKRNDNDDGRFHWFTLCCEAARNSA